MEQKYYRIPYEKRSLKELLDELPGIKKYAKVVFSRLERVTTIHEHVKVLDVGTSVGRFVIACNQLGYLSEGVDPNKIALSKAKELSKQLDIPILSDRRIDVSLLTTHTFDFEKAIEAYQMIMDKSVSFIGILLSRY